MVRTQVYLTDELRSQIDLLAKKEKKPAAKVLRELLVEGIKAKKPKESAGDALLRLANVNAKGPADLSKNIDKYLYE